MICDIIWGDMTYRPPIRHFFLGGGRVPPVPRGIYATAVNYRLRVRRHRTTHVTLRYNAGTARWVAGAGVDVTASGNRHCDL